MFPSPSRSRTPSPNREEDFPDYAPNNGFYDGSFWSGLDYIDPIPLANPALSVASLPPLSLAPFPLADPVVAGAPLPPLSLPPHHPPAAFPQEMAEFFTSYPLVLPSSSLRPPSPLRPSSLLLPSAPPRASSPGVAQPALVAPPQPKPHTRGAGMDKGNEKGIDKEFMRISMYVTLTFILC